MTITLNALGSCSTSTGFKIGDFCQFEMVIKVPAMTPTAMHVELFTSDNATSVMAKMCKPSITIGSNYNLTTVPLPELTSSLGTRQFDQAVIEFGTIQNSGSSTNAADNSITISFTVVIIENNQANGASIWITGGAEYYNGNEIWIGQTNLPFQRDTTRVCHFILSLYFSVKITKIEIRLKLQIPFS